jgi:membrane-bound lytic murein transglycosylase A
MNLNRSVVFFREVKGQGPIGAAGVPLAAGRSLAIDPKYAPLGGLVYIDVPHPEPDQPPIRRLVVAEDTGGAIKGPIRGDLFWGTGDAAGEKAGRMAAQGRYYLLAPKRR